MLHKIEKKIHKIEKYLQILQTLKPDCKKRFLSDDIYQGALLHYLYLVSDSCVSLSQMVLKYKNLDIAENYYDVIDLLGEYNIIPKEFAYSFAKIASLRNFLAHDYEKIDYLQVCDDLLNKLDDVAIFLGYLKQI